MSKRKIETNTAMVLTLKEWPAIVGIYVGVIEELESCGKMID
jgi:hypothetical protein